MVLVGRVFPEDDSVTDDEAEDCESANVVAGVFGCSDARFEARRDVRFCFFFFELASSENSADSPAVEATFADVMFVSFPACPVSFEGDKSIENVF